MKKRWILACLVMLLACICVCAQAETQTIFGGVSRNAATQVYAGIGYNSQSPDSGTVWYKFVPEESRIYTLTIRCLNNWYQAMDFYICDANGNEIASRYVQNGTNKENRTFEQALQSII